MTSGEAGNKPALLRSAEMPSGSASLAVIRSRNRLHDVAALRAEAGQPDQARCFAVAGRFQHSALQQFLVHGVDVHAPEDLGAPRLGQHVIGVGGVHGVAHAVLQRLAKAETVDGARAVFVNLGRRRFPAGEAAFAKSLDDFAQPGQDGIAFEVTGGDALVHTGGHGHASEAEVCLQAGVFER